MKKLFLAFVAFGSFTEIASAQTSVTMYGLVDAGFVNDSGSKAAGSVTSINSGIQNTSRIGFKGMEDLGDGLSAVFLLENGYNVDDGSINSTPGGLLFGRQAFVGVKGDFGIVKLGRQSNPLFNTLVNYDPFNNGLAGDFARVFSIGGGPSGRRIDNSIVYGTPEMGGFVSELIYGMGEQAGDTSKGRQMGFSAGYINGSLSFQVAQLVANSITTPVVSTKNSMIGGSYDFKKVKLYSMYEINKTDASTAAVNTRDWLLGVSAPFGASTVLASYIDHKNKALADSDSRQIAIGYTYTLSRRTDLYTSYSRLSNETLAKLKVETAGTADRIVNAGIRHLF